MRLLRRLRAGLPHGRTLTEKSVIEIGQPEHSVVTTCAYCGVGCSFKARCVARSWCAWCPGQDGQANRGHSCVNGRFAYGYSNHKGPHPQSMVREKVTDPWRDGHLGEGFRAYRLRVPPHPISVWRDSVGGITSSRCTNEETFLVQKLGARRLRQQQCRHLRPRLHFADRLRPQPDLRHLRGTQDFDSVEHTDVAVIIVPTRPTATRSSPRLKKAAAPGRQADRHRSAPNRPRPLRPCRSVVPPALKPGTNVAILTAIAHVIVTEGLPTKPSFASLRLVGIRGLGGLRGRAPSQPGSNRAIPAFHRNLCAGLRGLYATGGNGAIYYGLGVTEHSQGSTTVMAIANLAMLTGNIGRPASASIRCAARNNVQGSCDMGSFPHELPGYDIFRTMRRARSSRSLWGVTLNHEPGLRIPNMLDAAVEGTFKGLYVRARTSCSRIRTPSTSPPALRRWNASVVHDLFLNETANLRPCLPARIDLPRKGRNLHQMPSAASTASGASCGRRTAMPIGR